MAQPLRAAAVDIGSNGIRFIVADATGPDTFEVIHKQREAIRLGHQVFTEGHMDPDLAKEAVQALKEFRKKAAELGAHRMRVVATSAVRDAEDGRAFVKAARRVGVRIEAIDGREEARLVHRALRDRVPWSGKPWLIMDLGGGSLEIALVDQTGIHWSESRNIGTVRLLEKHARETDGPLLAERIHGEVDHFQLLHSEGLDIGGIAASGGNINELAAMDGQAPRADDAAVLPLATLTLFREELEQLTVDERIAAHGFRPDRADVIVPAAMVYERVTYLAGQDEILVPGWGVREGILLDLMDSHFGHRVDQDPLDKRVEDSALAVGRAFGFDEDHGQHVANLALSIFDQGHELHGLKPKHRRILHAAAILHDVGIAIAHKGHHKHGQYIIEHADLGGLSEKEVQMAATVARYHRKAFPQEHHHLYRMFGKSTRKKVDRLAAILRLANGLDLDHLRAVTGVGFEPSPIVGISLRGRGSLEEQRQAAKAKSDLFEHVFERSVEIS